MLNRIILLEKLKDYLAGNLTKDDIYQWALAQAVAKDFDQILKDDVLVGKTVSDLLEINRQEINEARANKTLEYYKRCLSGEENFDPSKGIEDISGEVIPDPTVPPGEAQPVKKGRTAKQLFTICRVYIIIFCLCSLGIHILSIARPEFLRFGDSIPSRLDTIKESLPHLLYAFVVILPVNFMAKGVLFFVTFPLLTLGMFYYWYVSVALVMKLSLNVVFAVVLLPFSAIPATLALVLLVMRRNEIKKKSKS